MNEQAEKLESPVSLAGTVSLGGELAVRRLGFGAMRITGDGIWGPPKNPDLALRCGGISGIINPCTSNVIVETWSDRRCWLIEPV